MSIAISKTGTKHSNANPPDMAEAPTWNSKKTNEAETPELTPRVKSSIIRPIEQNPCVEAAKLAFANRQSLVASGERKVLKEFYRSEHVSLYQGDAGTIMSQLSYSTKVDCIITSPPYYGQRDYGVPGQLGLESHPRDYLEKLVSSFLHAFDLLKPGGSLWVVIGDTYWSGKGKPKGNDQKSKHRRFDRPQDKSGIGPWCVPKQQLLIPYRFAIAMQDAGWIVRNDNIWAKTLPMPEPTIDRCALAHEFIFHFVKQRRYYFDMKAVAIPSNNPGRLKAPSTIWSIPPARTKKKHSAVFPEEIAMLPILATCPDDGIVLDPFCGSGTALRVALSMKRQCRVIGIDLSEEALHEAQSLLAPPVNQ